MLNGFCARRGINSTRLSVVYDAKTIQQSPGKNQSGLRGLRFNGLAIKGVIKGIYLIVLTTTEFRDYDNWQQFEVRIFENCA